MSTETNDNANVGATQFRRVNGLIQGVEYKFKPNGTIDWRAMIPPEHLVFNRQLEKEIVDKYGKPLSELSVTEVDDKYLLILLSGIKYIAKIRGYIDVDQKLTVLNERFVAATCRISWIGCDETDGLIQTFTDCADATASNTTGFGNFYLSAIAANRSFVRNVRNYLGINVVGADEIAQKNLSEVPQEAVQAKTVKQDFSIHNILKKLAVDLNYDFAGVKAKVIESNVKTESNPADWNDWDSIPSSDAYLLTDQLGKAKEARKAGKK